MSARTIKAGKPDTRQNGLQSGISLRIRKDILRGKHVPGSRLPARAELQKRYGTTPVTVQNAFRKLIKDGFARANGPRGTFVTENPPCLSNYAIVYPHQLSSDRSDISFFKVLANLANSGRYGPKRQFSLYFGLNGHVDEPDYLRLRQDVAEMRLAGIIFAAHPFQIAQTPLFKEIMEKKDLPKMAFMTKNEIPEIPAVTNDYDDCMRKALDYLQKQKCRRLAILHNASGGESDVLYHPESVFIAEVEKRGMIVKPWWIQGISPSVAHCARRLTQLVLQGPREERPDAIMIVDDPLVDAATKGIADAGLTVPGDLHVVGFCNFPELPPSTVPVKFFGLNVETFLDTCLESLDRQHAGKKVRTLTVLPAEDGETEDVGERMTG
jgi:DNA-binding LacI/PurR family transcriptional regulator